MCFRVNMLLPKGKTPEKRRKALCGAKERLEYPRRTVATLSASIG